MADGPTREDAIAAAREVIEIWIETARELGREIPQPRKYGAAREAQAA
jgi:predicted RNase H-like HicB family nuclease